MLFLAVMAAFIAYILWRHFLYSEGVLSTFGFFAVGCFLYYIAIPIELHISGEDGYQLSGGLYVGMDESSRFLIGVMAIQALIGFAAGIALSGFSLPRSPAGIFSYSNIMSPPRLPQNPMLPISAAGIAAFVFLFLPIIREAGTYEGNIAANYNNPSYAFMGGWVVAVTAISAAINVSSRMTRLQLVGVLQVLVLAYWSMYSSDKDPLVISVIACCGALPIVERLRVIHVLGFVVIPAVLILFLPVFSLLRAGLTLSDIPAQYYFGFTKIDPAGPMLSVVETISSGTGPDLGYTTAANLSILVPRFLYPDRPLEISDGFAQSVLVNWEPGMGVGYSLLAEAATATGPWGVVFFYFAIGWAWGKTWLLLMGFMRRHLSFDARAIRVIYFSVGIYLIVICHRGSTMQLIKGMFYFWIPFVLCITAWKLITQRKPPAIRTAIA